MAQKDENAPRAVSVDYSYHLKPLAEVHSNINGPQMTTNSDSVRKKAKNGKVSINPSHMNAGMDEKIAITECVNKAQSAA